MVGRVCLFSFFALFSGRERAAGRPPKAGQRAKPAEIVRKDDLACGRMCPPRWPAKGAVPVLPYVVIPAQVSYNIYIDYGTETENNTMTEKKEVQLFTDGACSGNPGPGGWGAILRYKGQEKELSGGEPMTTNNRMELLAAIEGLSALKQPCRVTLTSDSKYLVDAVTKGWVYGWQKKGWKKSDNSPALNVDLWERLLPLLKYHEVEFVWVKGHAGHPENERCDRLAVAWYQNYQAVEK